MLVIPTPVLGMTVLFVGASAYLISEKALSIESLVAQSPFVGGMLLMVWWFLRHIEKKDERSAAVIDRNTRALHELTIVVKASCK